MTSRRGPLSRVPPGQLRSVAIPALIVWAIAWPPFLLLDAAQEMMRLQFAGSESKARELAAGWSRAEVVDLAFLLGLDGVHLVAYGVLLTVGVVWAGRRLQGSAARWAPVLAWAGIAAAIFDIFENTGLVLMVRGETSAPVPALTMWFSMAKYAMFTVALLYIVAGIIARLRQR